jgi:hypothetical protein
LHENQRLKSVLRRSGSSPTNQSAPRRRELAASVIESAEVSGPPLLRLSSARANNSVSLGHFLRGADHGGRQAAGCRATGERSGSGRSNPRSASPEYFVSICFYGRLLAGLMTKAGLDDGKPRESPYIGNQRHRHAAILAGEAGPCQMNPGRTGLKSKIGTGDRKRSRQTSRRPVLPGLFGGWSSVVLGAFLA